MEKRVYQGSFEDLGFTLQNDGIVSKLDGPCGQLTTDFLYNSIVCNELRLSEHLQIDGQGD